MCNPTLVFLRLLLYEISACVILQPYIHAALDESWFTHTCQHHSKTILRKFVGITLCCLDRLHCSQKVSFRPKIGPELPNNDKNPTLFGTNWFQKIMNCYHFGEILDLFLGGNLLSVSTVYFMLVVTPKEGLAGTGQGQLSFEMTLII